MSKRKWIWSAAGYLVLRWILLVTPGYSLDLSAYKRWAIWIAREGIARVYQTTDMDYPPLYAYLLAPVGWIYGRLSPEALATMGDSTLLTFLVKLPPLVFDLAAAALLYLVARRIRPEEVRWRWILPAAYLMNPAVLYNQGYGGQPDSVYAFFLLAAFFSFTRRRDQGIWPGWICLALALCMKPLAAPFGPLYLLASLALFGLRRTLLGGAAALATCLLVFAPFLLTGQASSVFHRVVGDVGLMAFTSSNALNLWWIIGPWQNSEVPFLGPLTATQIGLGAFFLVYAAVLWLGWRLHRQQSGGISWPQMAAIAAGVGFSFFMLSTHMHENHLFSVIPLLACLLPFGRTWRWLFALVSIGIFVNCMVHDPAVSRHWPFTALGSTAIPNHPLRRPFYVVELAVIWTGTLLNLFTYAWFLASVFRGGGRSIVSLPASRPRGIE